MKKKVADKTLQLASFKFNDNNLQKAHEILKRYPEDRKKSAILPLLHLAQEQHENWIPRAAMDYIAEMLGVSYIHVYEVASFYSMFNMEPVGKYLVQVCRTTPCWLRGSDKICEKTKQMIESIKEKNKLFTLMEVECLGACVNAPVLQINNDYYENLTEEKIEEILRKLTEA